MSLELLSVELLTDPVNLGYAGKTAEECLALLTDKSRTRLKSISSAELLAWSAANGRLANLWDTATNQAFPAPLRSVARAAALLLERDGTSLDLNRPDRVALVDGLVGAGVLSSSDRAALLLLATEQISRLEELGLPKYHLGDVSFALVGHPN